MNFTESTQILAVSTSTYSRPGKVSISWWVIPKDGRPWMDLQLLSAEKSDAPCDIKVNNSATSTCDDNIQRESSRAVSRSPWKSWNFKKVAHVVWFVALFVPSFVYSYGQWPRTPVGYVSKLMDIVARVLISVLCVWTLFYNANCALCPFIIPP
jgi:hypothetical protein